MAEINVNAEINNISDYAKGKTGYIVARRSEADAGLWFYGLYETKECAQEVAIEIGNGIVFRKEG